MCEAGCSSGQRLECPMPVDEGHAIEEKRGVKEFIGFHPNVFFIELVDWFSNCVHAPFADEPEVSFLKVCLQFCAVFQLTAEWVSHA